MMTLILSAFAGALAGGAHVIAGPDHLSAVAPLALDARVRGWTAGVRWGLGHAAGVLAIGFAAIALRGLIPMERFSAVGERLAGVVLLGIGLWGLRRALRWNLHAHEHEHHGRVHVHFHAHAPGEPHDRPAAHGHGHAAFAVGTIHGLAGSAHVLGILPALALPTRAAGAAYLLAFGVGTIAAMAAFTTAVGMLGARATSRGPALGRGLMAISGCAAVAIGGWWIAG